MPIDNLVLIVGAGASRDLGCNSKPLPLMADWNDTLRGALDDREPGLARLVGISQGQSGPAFEQALGDFIRWQNILDLSARFLPLGEASPRDLVASDWQDRARARANTVVETFNRSLYAEFGEGRANRVAACDAYRALFEALSLNNDSFITVATTNYDPAVELALAELDRRPEVGEVDGPGGNRLLEPNGLVAKCHGGRGTAVLHLHGKVGWYTRDDGSVRVQSHTDRFNYSEGSPTVLWPDPDKNPLSQPAIQALWNEFDTALQQATHLLVLGHSLHDPVLVDHIGRSGARKAVTVLPEADAAEKERLSELIRAATVLPGRFGPHLQSPSEPEPFIGNLAAWAAGP